ncbi:unnamed protein product [Gongylonema pulchrum]|uniref:Prospero domain-containing protein n=1 Tax=Gongylonema pulchrum TaxID=637853 RepID=A0A183DM09_9BILA|nr:unnamed protein product [Gongylonema pulchrum]
MMMTMIMNEAGEVIYIPLRIIVYLSPHLGEFFYNQMDKYARNYLAEGVKNKEDIIVTPDSEIYKNLNQHYNRNNHIQVRNYLNFLRTLN